MRAQHVVLCLVVVVVSVLCLPAQQAVISPAASASNPLQSSSARLISFSDTVPGQPDGALTVTFTLYANQQDAPALWTETQVVQITNGKYTAVLGSTDPSGIPADLFVDDQPHWLAVQANGVETRHLLASVPYAMKAVEAERFGGLLPSQYVTVAQLQAILGNSATGKAGTAGGGTQAASPIETAAAAGGTPQPATDFTDNNTSEVLLVTQQGTGYAIHAISAGDAALFAENSSTTGTAMKALESSTTGSTVGLLVQTASPDSIPGVFDNTSGNGQILSLRSNGAIVITMSANGVRGNISATGTISGAFSGDGFGLTNIQNSATTATSANSNNTIVARDQFGNFSAGQVQAFNFVGSGFGLTNIPLSAVGATPTNTANSIVSRDESGNFSAGQVQALNFVGSGFGLTNIPNSATTATSVNSNDTIVARDQFGNFSAGQVQALNFVGSGFGLTNIPLSAVGATPTNTANSIVSRDEFGNFSAGQVQALNFVGSGFGLTNLPNSATTATDVNTPSAIVARDANGGFNAGSISVTDLKAAGLLTNNGVTDFSGSQATLPVRAVVSVNTPTTCQASRELLIKTDAPAGQQLFICNPTGDGYVLLGDGTAAGVTAVSAGDGSLSIGGTAAQPTIAVASGGITSDKLAPNAVASAIADGSLSPAKIIGTAATLGSNTFSGSQSIQQNLNVNGTLSAGISSISGSTVGSSLITVTQNGPGPAISLSGPGAAVIASGGTHGVLASGSSFGVLASSSSGDGVKATSTSSYGVFASSSNATGLHADGATVGADVSSDSGIALQATTTGTGLPATFTAFANNSRILSGRFGFSGGFTEKFSVDTNGNLFTAGGVAAQYPGDSALAGFVVSLFGNTQGNPATLGVTPAGATAGALGIALFSSAPAGFVQVATSGQVNCAFDGLPVSGDYVGLSKIQDGHCTDIGATFPSSGQVLGRVLGVNLVGAIHPVLLYGADERGLPAGTLTTINTGAGLTGGPITSSGTISIANGGVTNSMLQNSSVTITPGVGLSGGGVGPLGGSVILSNTGALSFNGRSGDILAAPGDYSFSQIAGTASAAQLPPDIAYQDQSNTFAGDQTIQGNLSTSGNIISTGSVTANSASINGSVTATSASINGSANPFSGVMSVTDNGAATFTAAFAAMSQNNIAGEFLSSGPTILQVGTPTRGVLIVSSTGATVAGALTATSLSGDGSALSNVTASKIGTLAPADIATASALTAETSERQKADTTLQSNIAAETTARQADVAGLQSSINAETTTRQNDVANLQTSINNVNAGDAKLAASNTFTAGTQDFSTAGATLPVRTVLSANTPASCVASKELLVKTDAPAGRQLFICDSSGTSWNLVGDGASGGVSSFNGRSGSVSPAANDYSFAQISGSASTAQLPSSVVYSNQANTFTASQTVNGTMAAELFTGNGSGLNNVNAATLNGIPSSGLAQLGAANTFTAPQTLAASTPSSASLNIPPGSLPNAPAPGDVWNTGGVLQYRDNLSTNRALVSTNQTGGMQLLKLTAAITPASVGSQTCSEQSFSVSGVSTGDVLLAVKQPASSSPGNNIAIGGSRVSAANTIAIQFCNVSRNSSTPVSGTYIFPLMR